MLCLDFEERLSDYVEGLLEPEVHRLVAEHALKCPICHETLAEVRSVMQACRVASVPPPARDLEARILQSTVPETGMNCQDFEDYLTDYLDGFLPAPLYHRWERHAAICDRCTELPGAVVRAIGACYSYISEEKPVPVGLNERILEATLGTIRSQEVRAPWMSRAASSLRLWLDSIVSPQLATVATMLLVAVMVLTNTVSTDGSIGGVYAASIRLAEQRAGTKGLADGLKGLVGGTNESPKSGTSSQTTNDEQNAQPKPDQARPDQTRQANGQK